LSEKTVKVHASTLAVIKMATSAFFRPCIPRIDVDFEVRRIIVGIVATRPDILKQGVFEVLRGDPFRNQPAKILAKPRIKKYIFEGIWLIGVVVRLVPL
jgi:hypothetical protein